MAAKKWTRFINARQSGYSVYQGTAHGRQNGPHGMESDNDASVHPMVAYMPEGANGALLDIDYFRRSAGYYWTFMDNVQVDNYRDFRFMNAGQAPDVAPNNALRVGFEWTVEGMPRDVSIWPTHTGPVRRKSTNSSFIAGPGGGGPTYGSFDGQYWTDGLGGSGAPAASVTSITEDITINAPRPNTWSPKLTGVGVHNLYPNAQVTRLILNGNFSGWQSYNTNSPPTQEVLNNEPSWTMWQTYMLGSANPQVSGLPAASGLPEIPGVLGRFTMNHYGAKGNSTIDMDPNTPERRGYSDHAFVLEVPENSVTATPVYNYYAAEWENKTGIFGLTSNDGKNVLQLPNLYGVLSVASSPLTSDYLLGPISDSDYGWGVYRENLAFRYQNNFNHCDGIFAPTGADLYEPISLSDIAYNLGQPDNLLTKVASPSIDETNGWSGDVLNANQYIGLGYEVTAEGRLAELSSLNSPWPFGVRVNIQANQSSGLLNIPPDWSSVEGKNLAMNAALTDFFLYEIMAANINGYGEEVVLYDDNTLGIDSNDWKTGGWAPESYHGEWNQVYETLYMDTDTWSENTNEPREFAGFGWLPSSWSPAPLGSEEAAGIPTPVGNRGYTKGEKTGLRTIDVKNLFLRQWNNLGREYASTAYGLGFSGMVGQGVRGVFGNRGRVIGTGFQNLPVGTLIPAARFMKSFGGVCPSALGTSGASALTLMAQTLAFYTNGSDGSVSSGHQFTSKMRSYEDMVRGALSYHEPLCYKISRYGVDDAGNVAAWGQHFFVPATGPGPAGRNDPTVINYFDTQVEYNKKYKYVVKAYCLVVGNQYNYSDRVVNPGPPTPYPSSLGAWLGFREQAGYALGGPPVDVITCAGNGIVGGPTQGPGSEPGENTVGDDDIEGFRIWLRNRGIAVAPFAVSYEGYLEQRLNPNVWDKLTTWKSGYLAGDAYVNMPLSTTWPFETNAPFWFEEEWSAPAGIEPQRRSAQVNHRPDNDSGLPPRAYSITSLLTRLNNARWGSGNDRAWAARFVTSANLAQWISTAQNAPGGEGTFVLAHLPSIQGLSDSDKTTAMRLIQNIFNLQGTGTWNLLGPVLDPIGLGPWPAAAPTFAELPWHGLYTGTHGNFARLHDACISPEAFDWYFGIPEFLDEYSGAQWPMARREMKLPFHSGPHGMSPSIPLDLTNAGTATVEVNNYSSLKIVEVPYGESEVIRVHDLPPMWPDATFYPLQGASNKVKILLNQFNTHDELIPVMIEPQDPAIFADMRASQDRVDAPGTGPTPILFGGDDSAIRFEVYRLDHPPTSYADFAGSRHKVLETQHGFTSVTAASLLDNIVPNVSYYYCFRTIDKGDYISNPSPVVKVQMVDNNGRIYFINEPHEMVPPIRGKKEKSFKRYLEIGASVLEKKIIPIVVSGPTGSAGNPAQDASCIVGQPDGVMRDAQNKAFKIRLTGKDTGRKLDLNVKFQIERTTNPKYEDN